MKGLALFDLDGTLTRGDTMVRFMYLLLGRPRSWALLLCTAPLIIAAKLGLVPDDAPKRLALRGMFRGRSLADVVPIAERFQAQLLPDLLRTGALERITWHREHSHRVVVVTASCSLWLRSWCERQGIELLATELEVDPKGRLTGRTATPNCKGPEKVRRIRAYLDLAAHAPIHVYGDTSADLPMLKLGTERHWKPFR